MNEEPSYKRAKHNVLIDADEDAEFNRFMMELERQTRLQQSQPTSETTCNGSMISHPQNLQQTPIDQNNLHNSNSNTSNINGNSRGFAYEQGQDLTTLQQAQPTFNAPQANQIPIASNRLAPRITPSSTCAVDRIKPEDFLGDDIGKALLHFNEFNDPNFASGTTNSDIPYESGTTNGSLTYESASKPTSQYSGIGENNISQSHSTNVAFPSTDPFIEHLSSDSSNIKIKTEVEPPRRLTHPSKPQSSSSHSAPPGAPTLSAKSSSSTPSNLSSFDSPDTISSSVTFHEEDHPNRTKQIKTEEPIQYPTPSSQPKHKQHRTTDKDSRKPQVEQQQQQEPVINLSTLASIKKSMVNTSKLMSTFTTLKTTYLKLCKEFNYLLSKFNDNERVKIELIHENNELKRLLTEIITQREMERKTYKKMKSQLVTRGERPVDTTSTVESKSTDEATVVKAENSRKRTLSTC